MVKIRFDAGVVEWFIASIVMYHFHRYSYYPPTLIMFGIAASVPTNSDDETNSCAMLISFYCTIHLRRTFLFRKSQDVVFFSSLIYFI